MTKWQLFPVFTPDLNNDRKLRWHWQQEAAGFTASSLGGFDSLEECVANAMEHGMGPNEARIMNRPPFGKVRKRVAG